MRKKCELPSLHMVIADRLKITARTTRRIVMRKTMLRFKANVLT